MTRGQTAMGALLGYGVLVGVIFALVAPWDIRFRLPVYGGDRIRVTVFAAVLFTLGVAFATFGSWAMSRGLARNGFAAVLLGCAAPLVTGSPIALVLSVPTLVGAFAAATLRANERNQGL